MPIDQWEQFLKGLAGAVIVDVQRDSLGRFMRWTVRTPSGRIVAVVNNKDFGDYIDYDPPDGPIQGSNVHSVSGAVSGGI